jgi:exodeoxyribonuclease I
MKDTLFWYDLETTGLDSILDRAIQFAGIRTDLDLELVAEPVNILSALSDDILVDPEAILTTGIDIEALQRGGLLEIDFLSQVMAEFMQPQTCVTGYNNLNFDDEFIRQALYRNLFEPYAREWQGGNSRWDVINLMRMAHALRPDGFSWPKKADGTTSFKLEHLAAANEISHDHAHDALSDVYATIGVTKKLRQVQPKLCEFFFKLRLKSFVLDQLYPLKKQMLIHIATYYPASRAHIGVLLPVAAHPLNRNSIICVDLLREPETLLGLTSEQLKQRLFAGKDAPADSSRPALQTLQINRCPAIAPIATLPAAKADSLGIDLALCAERQKILQNTAGLVETITEVYTSPAENDLMDPEFMLYGGEFFSGQDVGRMTEARNLRSGCSEMSGSFDDPRLDELLFRFKARNFCSELNDEEKLRWRQFKQDRWLTQNRIGDYQKRTAQSFEESEQDPVIASLIRRLQWQLEQSDIVLPQ